MTSSGKYIGYVVSIEGSTLIWNDNIENIQQEWSMGMAIFESKGLNKIKLKEIFPEPPERGVILDYLIENLPFVHQSGLLIGKINPTRAVLTEKINQNL